MSAENSHEPVPDSPEFDSLLELSKLLEKCELNRPPSPSLGPLNKVDKYEFERTQDEKEQGTVLKM